MKFRDELKWIIPLVLACAIVFANSLDGAFVYDDLRQILRNPLIQENGLIWQALTSDVWAFKGDGTVVASNYWRPVFTAWHILNFRLFGASPTGWHVTNLLLHSGVCVLAFGLLRRWGFSAMVAFAIALIFAVHPVHVESVAWISGSPDLLFALAFLGSLWFMQSYANTRQSKHLALSVVLYALALGAKEIGVVCLPIYYFVLTGNEADTEEPKKEKKEKAKKPLDIKSPLLVLGTVAVAWFLMRLAVLGAISRPPDDAVSLGDAVMSVPMMFAFYMRQIFFPYWVGANYPVEPASQIGVENFFLPLILSLAVVAGVVYLARTSNKMRLAGALFLLPLVTAMNATAFISEQIVHDRYLYLPLLGLLMLVIAFAAGFAPERFVLIGSIGLAILLSVQTVKYNTAWASDMALWSWTGNIDKSSFTSMQHGAALAEAERNDEAINAYSAAITKKPTQRGYLGRGRALIKTKQYAKAEADLVKAYGFPAERTEAYALYQTYEAFGLMLSEQGKYDAAIKGFDEARTKLPAYTAALTVNQAIVLYQGGRKDEALRQLEGARSQARKELLPESKAVFFRLGMLYAELGRKDEARASLQEFLKLTAAFKDKESVADRDQASKLLNSIR